MPNRSSYAGRHRGGRHRSTKHRNTSTLPTVAAAGLTLAAAGSAVLPAGTPALATAGEPTADIGRTPISSKPVNSADVVHVADQAASRLTEQVRRAAAESRLELQRRASRAAHRRQLEEEKKRRLAEAHRWVLPVERYGLSSGFGSRWGRLHAGSDFAAPIGTPVRSVTQGTVIFAGADAGYGNKVEVRHWDGTVTWYAHLSRITTRVGVTVAAGEQIGAVGNTGRSTGSHLHLEVRPDTGGPVDPRRWLSLRGLHI